MLARSRSCAEPVRLSRAARTSAGAVRLRIMTRRIAQMVWRSSGVDAARIAHCVDDDLDELGRGPGAQRRGALGAQLVVANDVHEVPAGEGGKLPAQERLSFAVDGKGIEDAVGPGTLLPGGNAIRGPVEVRRVDDASRSTFGAI